MTGLRHGAMVPPCSAASRCSAALRPCGRLRRPGPSLRAAVGSPVSSWPFFRPIEREPGTAGAQIVRDVLGANRLLRQAVLEGAPQRRLAVRLEERVEPLDVLTPLVRPAMRELGEIGQGRSPEIE
jgi:hypothetical protein